VSLVTVSPICRPVVRSRHHSAPCRPALSGLPSRPTV